MPPWPTSRMYTVYKTSKILVLNSIITYINFYLLTYLLTSHVYSIILVHQGRESMNGRTSGGVFWPAPATYVVSVRVYI